MQLWQGKAVAFSHYLYEVHEEEVKQLLVKKIVKKIMKLRKESNMHQ